MEFVYPNFLWALLAILIPVIIHLFYFKRFKKVYFSNTRFLKEIKEETTNKNKLKNILVLLSRILAIAALVFAFAQPYLPAGDKVKQGTKGVSIYIDNSFSMQALSEDVSLLDNAKKIAKEIVEAYPDNSVFQILTNKLYGSEQKWLNKENALEKIDNIKQNPTVKSLKNISKRQSQAFGKTDIDNKYVYWISDFQKTVFDISTNDIDSTLEYNLIVLQPVREKNISIDSCYMENPVPVVNHTNSLYVKITNNSTEDVSDVPVNIEYNGQNYPAGKVSIKAASSRIDTIELRIKNKGWNTAKISITDYPVVFDDDYYIAFDVPGTIKVLEINNDGRANPYLEAAFDNKELFLFENTDVNHIDYTGLVNYDLIIFDDVSSFSSGLESSLRNAVAQGTNVLIFPAGNMSLKSINGFLSKIKSNILLEYKMQENTANKINKNEFVFKNVYENPNRNIKSITTKSYFKISKFSNKNSYQIIKYKTGDVFLERTKYGLGNVYLCAAPLKEDINDLVKNPDVLVPLLFNVAISSNENKKLAYVIGKDKIIDLKSGKINEPIKIKNDKYEFIPRQIYTGNRLKIDVDDQIKQQGLYSCYRHEQLLKIIAFNYDRQESRLEYEDEKTIKERLGDKINIYGKNDNRKDFTELVKTKQQGVELWKIFIIIALVFLFLEILLLRFWKNKSK